LERAPTSAARWLRAALRVLPDDAPPSERAALLVGLAGALGATGRLGGSYSALLETLEIAPDDAPMPRVKLISACAVMEQLLGRHDDAHRRLARALEDLPDQTSADAAALMFDLAVDSFFEQNYDRMRDWGLRTRETATQADQPGLAAAGGAIAAFACSLSPNTIAEAHELHAEATATVDAMSDEELAETLNAVAWLAPADFYLDHYPEGIAHAERGLAIVRATGQSEFFPGLLQALANMLFSSGRPAEAADLLDNAVEAARLSDNAVGLAWSLLNRSFAASAAGDVEAALVAGEEATRLTAGMLSSPVASWAAAVHGIALLDSGDPEAAAKLMTDLCGTDEMRNIPGPWRVNWLEVMTRCYLELGRIAGAERTANLATEVAERYGLPLSTAAAHRAVAEVALAKGDAETAAERALAGATGAEEMGARIEAAHARVIAGRALSATADENAAVEQLERAASEFDLCGAPRHRDRAEQELRKLGRAVHRRTRRGTADGDGVASLTGRELEVARLVVDRRTNPEIAAELFLSIKTVETHMRNIFRKLDVNSRVEVARVRPGARPPQRLVLGGGELLALDVDLGQCPVEPARELPRTVSEHRHHRGHERHADDERVRDHAQCERQPDRLDHGVGVEQEGREHRGHDHRGGGDHPAAVPVAGHDGFPRIAGLEVRLTHPRDEEHLVVHRETEEDPDQEHR
jgi:DNA-binding CsgD family transcriptional regulator/tetratricopeptide (TPR) repeat protein